MSYDEHEDDYDYMYGSDYDAIENALNCDFDCELARDYRYLGDIPADAISVVKINGDTSLLVKCFRNDYGYNVKFWWNIITTSPEKIFDFSFPSIDKTSINNRLEYNVIDLFQWKIEDLYGIKIDEKFWETVNTIPASHDKSIGELLFHKPSINIKKYQQFILHIINETIDTMSEMLETEFGQYIIQQLTKKDQKMVMQMIMSK